MILNYPEGIHGCPARCLTVRGGVCSGVNRSGANWEGRPATWTVRLGPFLNFGLDPGHDARFMEGMVALKDPSHQHFSILRLRGEVVDADITDLWETLPLAFEVFWRTKNQLTLNCLFNLLSSCNQPLLLHFRCNLVARSLQTLQRGHLQPPLVLSFAGPDNIANTHTEYTYDASNNDQAKHQQHDKLLDPFLLAHKLQLRTSSRIRRYHFRSQLTTRPTTNLFGILTRKQYLRPISIREIWSSKAQLVLVCRHTNASVLMGVVVVLEAAEWN